MAGKRHHIIPRFLLKGFASRQEGDRLFAWTFRKGAAPLEINIDNIGVEKSFYGKEGTDEIITELETHELSEVVESFRKRTMTERVDREGPSMLVAHVMVRTRALRESFLSSTKYVTERLRDGLLMEGKLEKVLLDRILHNPEALLSSLPGITGAKKQMLISLLQRNASTIFPFLRPQLHAAIERYLAEFVGILPERVKEAHNKSLLEQPRPELRVQGLRSLDWSVIVFSTGLIISDVGPIARIGTGALRSLTDKDDEIREVFLAVSASHLLFGTRNSEVPNLSTDSLNEIFARRTFEHFVSASNGPREIGLHGILGNDSDIFPKEMLNAVCESVLSKLDEPGG
jgi:hypothetical protein